MGATQVFDDQIFAILVLMCLILMFFTTPAVVALYKPARTSVPYTNRKLEGSNGKKEQLRILACVHGPISIPPLLNLVEAFRGTSKKNIPLKLYAMHLIELSNRTSSIMTLSRARSKPEEGDGKKHISANNIIQEDNILVAFEAYRQISKIPVKLLTAVSELSNMHYDVCNEAAEKRATVILLPYMDLYQKADGTMEHIHSGLRSFHHRVMQYAPCTVGILVDKGLWGSELNISESTAAQKVAVFFFGGADDREALAFGKRLAEHPNIVLQVVRFVRGGRRSDGDDAADHVIGIGKCEGTTTSEERRCDEEAVEAVLKPDAMMQSGKAMAKEAVEYEEEVYEEGKAMEAMEKVAISKEFGLIVVGRAAMGGAGEGEMGVVGETLANAGEVKSSLLVIQQHSPSASSSAASSAAAFSTPL